MGKQEGMATVEYPQMKFQGFFHVGYVCIIKHVKLTFKENRLDFPQFCEGIKGYSKDFCVTSAKQV